MFHGSLIIDNKHCTHIGSLSLHIIIIITITNRWNNIGTSHITNHLHLPHLGELSQDTTHQGDHDGEEGTNDVDGYGDGSGDA
jgi:hypothetical protein